MKPSIRISLIIPLIIFSLLIQVDPTNAAIVLEYKVSIGDVMSYSVVKLTESRESLGTSKLNRTIWDIYGTKHT